ncbi:MAG: glutamate racemase [Desulfobacterales bacterium]
MIGIFDSGIGGLTVVKAIMERIPCYDIIYFGDTARAPYGNKSPETVIEYALQDMTFLLKNGAKIIIMACNTASSVAFDIVEKKFEAPVFEVITPAVELALESSRKMAIGVIGTRATVKSGIYEKKIKAINPGARVYSASCPLLVPLVEEGWIERPETAMIVKKYLLPLKVRQIDTLILGCTHYPLLKHVIQRKIGKRVKIIDSSTGVAEKVEKFLKERPDIDCVLSKNGKSRIFVSDVTDQFAKTARITLKQNVLLEQVKI